MDCLSASGSAGAPWRDCRRCSSSTRVGCRSCCCRETATRIRDWRIALRGEAAPRPAGPRPTIAWGASNALADGSGIPISQPPRRKRWRGSATASAAFSAARSSSDGGRPPAVAAKLRKIASHSPIASRKLMAAASECSRQQSLTRSIIRATPRSLSIPTAIGSRPGAASNPDHSTAVGFSHWC
jgi:hypothetical protein